MTQLSSPKRRAKNQVHSVLVVDDNMADRYIIQEAFSECGFEGKLIMASSPQEALQLLSEQDCDLMLSDFGADVGEGQAFIREIRVRKGLLPVVVLSGTHNSQLAYESGANAFVHKVNDWHEFVAKIRGILNFWLEVAELPSS